MKTINILAVIGLASIMTLSCNERSQTKETSTAIDSANNSSPETALPADSIPEDSVYYEIPLEEDSVNLFTESSVDIPKSKVDVVVHQINGYGSHEKFARAAADTLEVILNSKGFKRAVESNTYDMDLGRTPKQIYESIMKAHEEAGSGGTDGVLDFRMRTITLERDGKKWIKRCTKRRPNGLITVGKDGGNTGVMATCENWIQDRAAAENHARFASHMMHEYMHILGYSHKDAKDKLATVPYKIGRIVTELGKNYRARN